MGQEREQSGTQKWNTNGNKVGTKIGTKWEQESQSGTRMGTKWDKNGNKNPKVNKLRAKWNKNPTLGQEWESGDKKPANKVGARIHKWDKNGNKVAKVGQEWEQSGTRT